MMKSKGNESNKITDRSIEYSVLSKTDVFKVLETSKDGLSNEEAGLRLVRYGPNTISKKKEMSVVFEYFSHFKNPLVIILLAAASISAYLGELRNLPIIGTMVIASVTLDFFEEHSANNSAKKLRDKVSVMSTVL